MLPDAPPGMPSQAPTDHLSWLRRATRWLGQTRPSASPTQRRQARLVAWLVVGTVALGSATSLVFLLVPDLSPALSAAAWLFIASISVLLGLAFWLNRTGQTAWAAWLVVLLTSTETWGIVLSDRAHYASHPELRVELLFPLLAILLCGLLLPAWVTGLWAAA